MGTIVWEGKDGWDYMGWMIWNGQDYVGWVGQYRRVRMVWDGQDCVGYTLDFKGFQVFFNCTRLPFGYLVNLVHPEVAQKISKKVFERNGFKVRLLFTTKND